MLKSRIGLIGAAPKPFILSKEVPSRCIRASVAEVTRSSLPTVSCDDMFEDEFDSRPLIPSSVGILQDALRAPAKTQMALNMLFDISFQGPPGPRIYKPEISRISKFRRPSTQDMVASAEVAAAMTPSETAELPFLIYLPGIDGTGLAAYRQFPELCKNFDLHALFIPPEDRSGFESLVLKVNAMLQAEISQFAPERPVYLLGESFGGLMCLALAQQMPEVDRIILVNPATNYSSSAWPDLGPLLTSLPAVLYNFLPIGLAPILCNPLAIAMHGVRTNKSLPNQASDFIYSLADLVPELNVLREVLPPDVLAWRLRLLKQGAESVNKILGKVTQRTLLLSGQLDFVVPQREESERLQGSLKRCQVRTLPLRSHAMLLEAGVDLMTILHEEGFYTPVKRLSNQRTKSTSSISSDSDDFTSSGNGNGSGPSPKMSKKRATSGAAYGTAAPIERATRRELEIASEAAGMGTLRTLCSPVYFSTSEDGIFQKGLGGVPLDGRPIVFIGNHQLLALDMGLMLEDFMTQQDTLLRGLAHPWAMALPDSGFGGFIETYGATPVSGKNMYQLLSQGDAVLLYPGGAREALKCKDEKYKLVWPAEQEFVRLAARFGAWIVPFAGIGAEDSLNQVLDAKEMLALPGVGDFLRSSIPQGVRSAREGVNKGKQDNEDLWGMPLVSFNQPARLYYKFQQPIQTTPEMLKDRDAAQAMYVKIKTEIEDGISYLLEKREEDPYKDLVPRMLNEASTGVQAPTFEL